jgi:hypothetical protein
MTKESIGTRLAIALRKKYRTPAEALEALGMDPALLVMDTATDDALAKALTFLAEKLDADDLAEVKRLLIGKTVEGSDYPEKNEARKGEAKDGEHQPAMLPRPGAIKMVAQDAKPRETWEARFPMAARIRVMN